MGGKGEGGDKEGEGGRLFEKIDEARSVRLVLISQRVSLAICCKPSSSGGSYGSM